MMRVIGCLSDSHDLVLVAGAALLCAGASMAVLGLLDRARGAASPWARRGWLAFASATFGGGVWATHFVAMLGYDPGLPVSYEISTTIASAALLVAVGVCVFGTCFNQPSRTKALIGGALLGGGVGAMHYLGMAALRLPGRLTFEADLVISSVLLGAAFCSVAMALSVTAGARARLAAVALLAGGIVSLHFTGMGAVQIWPDGNVTLPANSLDRRLLGGLVGSVAMTLLVAAVGAVAFEARHRAARSSAEAARMRALAGATFEGIAVLSDDETICDANHRLAEMLGQPLERVVNAPLSDFLSPVVGSGHSGTAWLLGAAADGAIPASLRGTTGSVPVEVRTGEMLGADGAHRVLAIRDLRERKAAEARIAHMAHHDGLTGLTNRVLLKERLSQELARARREGGQVAVFCLDLDRFKMINDTLGHPKGDALLQGIAACLLRNVRETDTVARLGGDEFVIVQASVTQPNDAIALAKRIVEEVCLPHDLDGHQVVVGTSIGIAISPGDGEDPDTLLRNADLALYRAKSQERGSWCFFEPEMDARMQARRTLELDLRRAVALGEFELFYQPTLDLQTRVLQGFEALIRWNHPERGLIPPGEFIPLAEEIGLIIPIGEWALRRACSEAVAWPSKLKVAVNLSPVQFAGRGPARAVSEALESSGLDPARLELEITETVMLRDTEATLTMLQELKALGVGIAMDDFGTGYSSLSYLRRFPFDRVKIDRSFIKDIGLSHESTSIVRAVAQLCESLGMAVTAEGVESEQQMMQLEGGIRTSSVMEVQGYLFSRPQPGREVPQLCRTFGTPELELQQ
ncbi:EAL domain-containing protein [Roseomonas sp. SSH11]|uniref:EAL domain-containing protein n=1 Tax=Pararoseomonas baculiformis TaxID=2820812 RepID=A0ABS4ALK0_9PROT|nr:EAL domain-containing protein [Pararoseomonas baculiformis]MBP0447746.1 EAL domain-containing protein [Pararoseomonas baculiformis]